MEKNNFMKTGIGGATTTSVVPVTTTTAGLATVAQDAMLPENFYESLPPEKKAEVDKIVESMDIHDVAFVTKFGSEYKAGIDKFSSQLLEGKSTMELGNAGVLLDNAVKLVSDFNVEDPEKPGLLDRLFLSPAKATKKNLEKAVKRIQTQYKDVNGKIEVVANQLLDKQTEIMAIYDAFDSIYQLNRTIYDNMCILVCAAQLKLKKEEEVIENCQSNPNFDQLLLRTYQSDYSRFNKKTTNLVAMRYCLFSLFPKVELIKTTALDVYDAMTEIIETAIPLWKSEMAIAVGVQSVTAGARIVNDANAATNRIMLEVSQASQDMVLEAAKASSTGVLDIETVRTLNENLINTLKTKNQLRIEGDKKLKNEGAEIARLHEELVQNLQTLE